MMSRTAYPPIQPLRDAGESSVPLSVSASGLVRPEPWLPAHHDGLVVLHGHQAVLRLGLRASVDLALAGESVTYVDGAHSFDPFVIGRLARIASVPPRQLLAAIRVSRAATCHQMVQLVTERLGESLREARGRAIILSGPLEPLYDESVPAAEAVRLAQVLFASLRLLSSQGCRILCLCPPPSLQRRTHLLEALRRKADRVIEAVEGPEGLVLRERRASLLSSWSLPHEAWTGL